MCQTSDKPARSAGVLSGACSGVFSAKVCRHPNSNCCVPQAASNALIMRQSSLRENHPGRDPYSVGIPVCGLLFGDEGFDHSCGQIYSQTRQRNRFCSSQEGHGTSVIWIFSQGIFYSSLSSGDNSFRDNPLHCLISRCRCIRDLLHYRSSRREEYISCFYDAFVPMQFVPALTFG